MVRVKLSRTGLSIREDEILGYYKTPVTKFGNGAKIGCFHDFLRHEAVVIILKRGETL